VRILICLHDLQMGGSQINALELGAVAKKHGHEVIVYAPTGLLRPFLDELDLEFVAAPRLRSVLSPFAIGRLTRLAHDRRVDLIHTYEWAPSIQAAFGPHVRWNTPTVMTVLSMDVPHFLPAHLPLIVGTRELAARTSAHRNDVYLMEPQIDTEHNRARDVATARALWGFESDQIVLAIVCRLTNDLGKLQGVLEAIEAVNGLAMTQDVRLLIAGDGAGNAEVKATATEVNMRHGREVVVTAGSLLDPRPAYEAADIVIGMGSSALKGMAFGKPLVVQGTGGYWKLLDEHSVDGFLRNGWFGHGGRGARDLESAVEYLIEDRIRASELGAFGRNLVVSRFRLEDAGANLLSIYEHSVQEPSASVTRYRSLARSAFDVVKFRTLMGARRARDRIMRVEVRR
jgi:glycosyltransferase involved in cell wall biosynthesis